MKKHGFRIVICAAVASLFGATEVTPSFATGGNVTPYDSEAYMPSTLAPRSTASYFIMDALLPKEFQGAFDEREFFGLSGAYFGGIENGGSSNSSSISVNDLPLPQQTATACSVYNLETCFDISDFYAPRRPQIGAVGLYAIDGSTIIQWGLNTGYDSQKLTVSPSFMIGLAKRLYLTKARNMHLIFEASEWFGAHVKHRPCFDDYDRAFYCGDLTAWADYVYEPRPRSTFYKVTFETVF